MLTPTQPIGTPHAEELEQNLATDDDDYYYEDDDGYEDDDDMMMMMMMMMIPTGDILVGADDWYLQYVENSIAFFLQSGACQPHHIIHKGISAFRQKR